MTKTEHCCMLLGMWICLFPMVTAIIYIGMWLEPTWPIWTRILIATAAVVPFMKFVVMPTIMALIARSKGMTVFELHALGTERAKHHG